MSRRLLGTVTTLVLAMGLILFTTGTSLGAPADGPVLLTLGGKTLSTTGAIRYGLTMVPLDPLAADLGMEIRSVYEDRVLVSKGKYRVDLGVGSSMAVVNGHEIRGIMPPAKENGKTMVPLRFLLENMGYDVVWQDGPQNTADIRPIEENDIIIGTVRERQETATLSIDVQYPKVAGLAPDIQDSMNTYFADRINTPKARAHESDRVNTEAGQLERPTQLFCNYLVQYNRNELLSLTMDDYLYSGGAHGGTIRSGYTVDVSSGKTFDLKDLFAPGTDYVTVLSEEVGKHIVEQELATLAPFTAIRPDQDFYLSGHSLVIYFQQYELMPYSYGFPEFRIPLSSLQAVLIPGIAGISG